MKNRKELKHVHFSDTEIWTYVLNKRNKQSMNVYSPKKKLYRLWWEIDPSSHEYRLYWYPMGAKVSVKINIPCTDWNEIFTPSMVKNIIQKTNFFMAPNELRKKKLRKIEGK